MQNQMCLHRCAIAINRHKPTYLFLNIFSFQALSTLQGRQNLNYIQLTLSDPTILCHRGHFKRPIFQPIMHNQTSYWTQIFRNCILNMKNIPTPSEFTFLDEYWIKIPIVIKNLLQVEHNSPYRRISIKSRSSTSHVFL